MPKSRNRKDHKKKVKLRNEKIKSEFKKAQKNAWDKFQEHKQATEVESEDDFQYPEFK